MRPRGAFDGRMFVSVAALLFALFALKEPGVSAGPAELSATNVAQLSGVSMRVAVPGYLPPEYNLIRVEVHRCPLNAQGQRSACKFGPAYALHYAKGVDSGFVIEGVGGGIGDTGDDYQTTVRTALFGPTTLYFGSSSGGPGLGAMKPSPPALMLRYQSRFISEWAGGRNGPFYHIRGHSMRPVDVAKVLASLHWLR